MAACIPAGKTRWDPMFDFICSGEMNPPGIKILPVAKCLDALTREQRAGR